MKIEVWDLLKEINCFEEIIRNSMMPEEREIIKGINFVREIVEELNPNEIDNEFLDTVNLIIDKYEKQLKFQMKIMNSYMRYGISKCVSIINAMINLNESNKKNYIVKKRQV